MICNTIITKDYILITDDSVIEVGDYYINTEPDNPLWEKVYLGLPNVIKNGYEGYGYKDKDYFRKYMRKVVGYLPYIGSRKLIDVPFLPMTEPFKIPTGFKCNTPIEITKTPEGHTLIVGEYIYD